MQPVVRSQPCLFQCVSINSTLSLLASETDQPFAAAVAREDHTPSRYIEAEHLNKMLPKQDTAKQLVSRNLPTYVESCFASSRTHAYCAYVIEQASSSCLPEAVQMTLLRLPGLSH